MTFKNILIQNNEVRECISMSVTVATTGEANSTACVEEKPSLFWKIKGEITVIQKHGLHQNLTQLNFFFTKSYVSKWVELVSRFIRNGSRHSKKRHRFFTTCNILLTNYFTIVVCSRTSWWHSYKHTYPCYLPFFEIVYTKYSILQKKASWAIPQIKHKFISLFRCATFTKKIM